MKDQNTVISMLKQRLGWIKEAIHYPSLAFYINK